MNRLAIVLLCLLALTTKLNAETPSVFLEDMTWTELRDAVAAGKTTIIIPVGGTEQSGPLVALGKHNTRVHFLVGKIAEALQNAIVAPVVAYVPEGNISPPTGHMKFPGTITVTDQVFEQVIEQAARGFKQNHFKDIILIGDHGGYQSDLAAVADRLNKQWRGNDTKVHFIPEYYRAAEKSYVSALLSQGVAMDEIGTHAGLADTSLTLAIEPKMVRSEGLPTARHFSAADGIYGGDPTHSSAKLGQIGVDLIIRETVEAIRHAVPNP